MIRFIVKNELNHKLVRKAKLIKCRVISDKHFRITFIVQIRIKC